MSVDDGRRGDNLEEWTRHGLFNGKSRPDMDERPQFRQSRVHERKSWSTGNHGKAVEHPVHYDE